MRSLRVTYGLLIVLLLAPMLHQSLRAQDDKKSPVYKSKYKFMGVPYILYSAYDFEVVEIFKLMQEANTDQPVAQHELGLRYLLGAGLPADTAKAVYWMMKAAEHDLPLAHFNLGIMHLQGIGVPWNPFEAFKHFRKAADEEIPEALFLTGVMYSENFVVKRDWAKTFSYIKRAAGYGIDDAKEALKELRRRGIDSVEASEKRPQDKVKHQNLPAQTPQNDSTAQLVFIDFQNKDTTSVADDTTLVREAFQHVNIAAFAAPKKDRKKIDIDSANKSILMAAADVENPEALCVLGKCYEEGLGVPKDPIVAGEYYFRAIRAESFRAPALLWHLMNTEHFEKELESRTIKNDPDALFLWAGLTALDFSKVLSPDQALKTLKRSAAAGHIPSMVELGLCYFNGRWTAQNKMEAAAWWTRAAEQGSTDAKFHLMMMHVGHELNTEPPDTILAFLQSLAKRGSLLADVAVGLCYETGYAVPQNKGEAYRIYQKALHRGSETAFLSLMRMHDELRPSDPEFQLN